MPTIHAINAFQDNYIWAIVHNGRAIIVDPGDAGPVRTFLDAQQLTLAALLITHWHPDHTGGLESLATGNIPVYGPDHPSINPVTEQVIDNQDIMVEDFHFTVLAVPGHTLEHVAYYNEKYQWLFCGDTLFAGGCGRLFEGTPVMMYDSLTKLAALPADTRVYCAHEYTLANLRFAQIVEPDNRQLQQRIEQCRQLRDRQQATIPSTIADELATNPFLRTREPEVVSSALSKGAVGDMPVDIFACLRDWKNSF